MTLGQRIQHHRTKLDLSQEGLGERLGVTRQAVSKWEADGAVPDTDKLIALSKLFHISLNELLQVEEPAREEDGPRPKKRRPLGPILCLAALAVGMAAFTFSVGSQLTRLEDRVAVLEEEAAHPGLDPAAPLVATFDMSFLSYSLSNPVVQLTLTPAQRPDGLEVSFRRSGGITVESVEGEMKPGGWYSATLSLGDLHTPFTITASLSDGKNTYTQGLVSVTAIGENYHEWTSLWKKRVKPSTR